MSTLKPDWLTGNDYKYIGEFNGSYRWQSTIADFIYYEEDKETRKMTRIYLQGPGQTGDGFADDQMFDISTYTTDFDNKIFNLPTGSASDTNCQTPCPANTLCPYRQN